MGILLPFIHICISFVDKKAVQLSDLLPLDPIKIVKNPVKGAIITKEIYKKKTGF